MRKKCDKDMLDRFFYGREDNMEKFMEAYDKKDFKLNENGHKVCTIEIINDKGENETVDFVII
jgi:hypothetical protein